MLSNNLSSLTNKEILKPSTFQNQQNSMICRPLFMITIVSKRSLVHRMHRLRAMRASLYPTFRWLNLAILPKVPTMRKSPCRKLVSLPTLRSPTIAIFPMYLVMTLSNGKGMFRILSPRSRHWPLVLLHRRDLAERRAQRALA